MLPIMMLCSIYFVLHMLMFEFNSFCVVMCVCLSTSRVSNYQVGTVLPVVLRK